MFNPNKNSKFQLQTKWMKYNWLNILNFVLLNRKRQTSLILFQPIIATNYLTFFQLKTN